MKIHTILHASFETAGSIENWAYENSHSLDITHSYLNQPLPNINDFDFLIIMGGPQSPREQDIYPYLTNEISLIKDAIKANKYILGFCLGAQLIGEALGAVTLKSPEKEVGIWPITLTEDGKNDPLFEGFGDTFDVIHWHNDMPGIPEGSVIIASSPGCPHQAFRYNKRVYGLQFHMEFTQDNAKTMCDCCPDDLKPSKFTQSKEDILTSDLLSINQKLNLILNRFTNTNSLVTT